MDFEGSFCIDSDIRCFGRHYREILETVGFQIPGRTLIPNADSTAREQLGALSYLCKLCTISMTSGDFLHFHPVPFHPQQLQQ